MAENLPLFHQELTHPPKDDAKPSPTLPILKLGALFSSLAARLFFGSALKLR